MIQFNNISISNYKLTRLAQSYNYNFSRAHEVKTVNVILLVTLIPIVILILFGLLILIFKVLLINTINGLDFSYGTYYLLFKSVGVILICLHYTKIYIIYRYIINECSKKFENGQKLEQVIDYLNTTWEFNLDV